MLTSSDCGSTSELPDQLPWVPTSLSARLSHATDICLPRSHSRHKSSLKPYKKRFRQVVLNTNYTCVRKMYFSGKVHCIVKRRLAILANSLLRPFGFPFKFTCWNAWTGQRGLVRGRIAGFSLTQFHPEFQRKHARSAFCRTHGPVQLVLSRRTS